MTETYKGCKEMTEDEFLTMVDNSPELKKKFEQLGISNDDDGLTVALNYYELLTEAELSFLKKNLSQFYPGSEKDDAGFYVKFYKEPDGMTFCFSNVICDTCYKALLEVRKHPDHLSSKAFGAND